MINADIRKRVARDFGAGAPEVLGELEQLSAAFREAGSSAPAARVIRCVVHLAKGNREDLRHYLQAARADWRDVIYWAEHDEDGRRANDFGVAFDDR